MGSALTARGPRAGPSQPMGLRVTDLECFLRNTVLHTLQHVHVGMWPHVKEDAEQEEQDGPETAALESPMVSG